MNRNITFLVKLIAVALIAAGMFMPLISAGFSTEWIGAAPTGAPPDFEGTIWELGILTSTINEITYDEMTNTYELVPAPAGNDIEEAFGIFQQIFMIIAGVAAGLILLGALIHRSKNSKFASFLIFLGVLALGAILAFISFIQTSIVNAIGGSGNSFSSDSTVTQGTETFTYRITATISTDLGFILLAAGAALAFISLFLKSNDD